MSIEVMETTRTLVETSQVLKCDGCGAICDRVNDMGALWPPEPPDSWICMRSGLWRENPDAYDIKHACTLECARKVLSFEYAEVPL